MTNSKPIRKTSIFLAIIIGLTATLLMPTSGTPAWGQNLTPAAPTNLEMTDNRTDDELGHVAVLQWDYDDGEGYLLESRDGSSGPWNCIVAGTYSSQEPSGTSTGSTVRGCAMAASDDWRFRVRNFNSQQSSYPGEATCDEDADYGYIFDTRPGQGYSLSPSLTVGPLTIPSADYSVPPDQAVTGLTVAAGAAHRTVQVSWDKPAQGSNTTGVALFRKWKGHSNAAKLCFYWSPDNYITSWHDTEVAAYDSTGNRNQYVYTVYPLNAAVASPTGSNGCDGDNPSTPDSDATATLALSTDIVKNSDGDLEYVTPPAPTGLTLEPRLRGYRNDVSVMRATWDDLNNAPGYKLRWRENGETDWRERSRSRKLEPNANACTGGDNAGTIESTLNDGRVWCIRENGKLLTTTVTPWPWMFNAGPGGPNDNIAPARRGISALKNNVRHEVQVATCTDQSCEGNGAWSSSRYATSR